MQEVEISIARLFAAGIVLTSLLTGAAEVGADPIAPINTAAATAEAAVTTDGPVSEALMEQGKNLFVRSCRQCHGVRGTAGVPLKENAKLADASYVAGVILVGPGYMAAFDEVLNDEEIAAIASFVRNSWGNAYGAVTPGDVAELR